MFPATLSLNCEITTCCFPLADPERSVFWNLRANCREARSSEVGCENSIRFAATSDRDKFVVSRTVEAYDAAETDGQDTIVEGRPRLDEFKESTMLDLRTQLRSAAAAALAIMIAFGASSLAADILDDWATAKAPPPPELKPVTLEGSTTALLILDMMKANCGARPRCVATVPAVKKLHDAARAAGAMVWYSFVGSNGMATPADVIDPGFMAREGEWVRQNGPDKFIGSNLEEKLKARGIKTVIV